MVERSSQQTEAVDRVAKAIDEAVAKWQPGSGQRIHEMAARAAIEAFGAAQRPAVAPETVDAQFAADAVSDEDLIAEAPAIFRQLAANLAQLLDDDHWNNIEPYLLDVARLLRGQMRAALSDTSTDRGGK